MCVCMYIYIYMYISIYIYLFNSIYIYLLYIHIFRAISLESCWRGYVQFQTLLSSAIHSSMSFIAESLLGALSKRQIIVLEVTTRQLIWLVV